MYTVYYLTISKSNVYVFSIDNIFSSLAWMNYSATENYINQCLSQEMVYNLFYNLRELHSLADLLSTSPWFGKLLLEILCRNAKTIKKKKKKKQWISLRNYFTLIAFEMIFKCWERQIPLVEQEIAIEGKDQEHVL